VVSVTWIGTSPFASEEQPELYTETAMVTLVAD
jgi:hypothetical protein